jgi:anaerobic selenocysteine-containing dehydrogenase
VNAGDATAASNGLASAMAVLALNALLGNVERPGGLLVQREAKFADWEAMDRDEISRWGLMAPRLDGVGTAACPLGHHRVQAVPAAINAERPYSVQVLLLRKTDPLAELPGRQAWTAALQKVPFVVSFSSLLDQTTQFADLVLPESMPLETWDVVTPAPATGEPLLGFRQPVVSLVHDTQPAGQIVLTLAAAMGGSIGRSLPWKTYQDAVAVRLQGLLAASDDEDGPEDVKSLLADMQEKGGWCSDPAKAAPRTPVLATRSSKFQWASMGIMLRLRDLQVGTDWPCVGLPPWQPARVAGAPSEFPFQLLPYRPASFVERNMGFLPWLGEVPGLSGDPWSDHAEIHPGDAARLGLADGDRVLVESPAGSCEAVAQISDRVCAGVVAMAMGKGGVLNLVVPDEDPLTGVLAWQGTRVRLRKMS